MLEGVGGFAKKKLLFFLIHFQHPPLILFADLGMKETDATVGHEMLSHRVFLSCQLYISLYIGNKQVFPCTFISLKHTNT